MNTFRRGLSSEALAALSAMAAASSDNWWKDLLALWSPSGSASGPRPLRLAVRGGYLSFYYRGQSVAKVSYNRRTGPCAEVHAKYAFAGTADQAYAKLLGTSITSKNVGQVDQYRGAATLQEWIVRAARWETPEKVQVEWLTSDNAGIIDLEMGLPADAERTAALRIDAVALERTPTGAQVVFWEAKQVKDGRIRSRSPRPEVVDQIEAYRTYLADDANSSAVIEAYRETCRTVLAFAEMSGGPGTNRLDPIIGRVADGSLRLTIDKTPRLVIFGKDAELRHPSWAAHETKLTQLGVHLLTMRSDPYRLPEFSAQI